ncbi:MAG: hypothetical protein R3B40_23575 [Polyangiales bacterium]
MYILRSTLWLPGRGHPRCQRVDLQRFLKDGRLPLELRRQAVGRKNGSSSGATTERT